MVGIVKEQYRQCSLVRDNVEYVAWIPSTFAKEGAIVFIDGKGKWKVNKVYGLNTRQDLDNLRIDYTRWSSVIK